MNRESYERFAGLSFYHRQDGVNGESKVQGFEWNIAGTGIANEAASLERLGSELGLDVKRIGRTVIVTAESELADEVVDGLREAGFTKDKTTYYRSDV